MEKYLPNGVTLGKFDTTLLADFTAFEGSGVELRYLCEGGESVLLEEEDMETLIAEWRRRHPWPVEVPELGNGE